MLLVSIGDSELSMIPRSLREILHNTITTLPLPPTIILVLATTLNDSTFHPILLATN